MHRFLAGLWRVNDELLGMAPAQHPVAQAARDTDATPVETQKRGALYCCKHFKAFQPLNIWWAEQGLVLHSEFRDGNVPAALQRLRVLEEGGACCRQGDQALARIRQAISRIF